MTPKPSGPVDPIVGNERSWRIFTGRLAEWTELLEVVAQRRGLTVIVSDPWSGTSGLLEELSGLDDVEARAILMEPPVLVDARRCTDVGDLAVAVADAAVARWAPKALSSWTGQADQYAEEGLRLQRELQDAGISGRQPLPAGAHPALRLRAALDVFTALSRRSAAPTLCVDHLGRMLTGLRAGAARAVLDAFRTLRQAEPTINLLLGDYTGGPIAAALEDRDHPLYRAGGTIAIRRANAERISGDLMITKPQVRVHAPILHEAAVLADGVPVLTWQIVELAYSAPEGDPAIRAQHGWQQLRTTTEPIARREWDAIRHLHSAAQAAAAALALDRPPHSLPLAAKSIRDALLALRDAGIAWQPEPRTWKLADPLLAEWITRSPPVRHVRVT